jgi:hypothetical protein
MGCLEKTVTETRREAMVKGKKRNAGTLERQARQMAADLYHSANGIAPHAAYHLFDALAKNMGHTVTQYAKMLESTLGMNSMHISNGLRGQYGVTQDEIDAMLSVFIKLRNANQ